MRQKTIYALDFDGVICDSAIETGIAGWKTGARLWDDFLTPLPSSQLLEQFRQIRPMLETGYESILIIRLLFDGETVNLILDSYSEKIQETVDKFNLDIDSLKKLFGQTRDQWINDDPENWIEMNPLFDSIVEKLQALSAQGIWYIITTKQERFVKEILNANQIQLAEDKIFGLDRKMSKEAVLTRLLNKHAGQEIYFVEDRLPTLINILNNETLKSIKLFFALWGYNTVQNKIDAADKELELINLDDFCSTGFSRIN